MVRRSSRASAYEPLRAYLASLSPHVSAASLTLTAIERVIGRPLPRSAQGIGFWNARASTGIGRVLRVSGFRAELTVADTGLVVTFRRHGRRRASPPRTRTADALVVLPEAPTADRPAGEPDELAGCTR